MRMHLMYTLSVAVRYWYVYMQAVIYRDQKLRAVKITYEIALYTRLASCSIYRYMYVSASSQFLGPKTIAILGYLAL